MVEWLLLRKNNDTMNSQDQLSNKISNSITWIIIILNCSMITPLFRSLIFWNDFTLKGGMPTNTQNGICQSHYHHGNNISLITQIITFFVQVVIWSHTENHWKPSIHQQFFFKRCNGYYYSKWHMRIPWPPWQ